MGLRVQAALQRDLGGRDVGVGVGQLHGHEGAVVEAADGVEAVQKTRSLQPDVILLDMVMPRKDGLQAINEIISRYQRIKADFKLRLLNPDIDIEQVQKDGVVMNKPFAFVIYYKGRMEHIDSLSEHSISNALLRLNRRENQQVVFLSGHGERDLRDRQDDGPAIGRGIRR